MRRVLTVSLAVLVMTLLLTALSAGAIADTGTSTNQTAGPGAERLHIAWYQAKHHMGERRVVTGPVKGMVFERGLSGRPTFINMGRDYPSKQRFTVVIWGKYRHSFPFRPEVKYKGKTLRVTGAIRRYEGIAEMFVRSSGAIEILR